jgi:hypothetical protein
MTGMTRNAFMLMEKAFFRSVVDDNKRKRGRPPALDNHSQLGLDFFLLDRQ